VLRTGADVEIGSHELGDRVATSAGRPARWRPPSARVRSSITRPGQGPAVSRSRGAWRRDWRGLAAPL